jgi:hypothetical protein
LAVLKLFAGYAGMTRFTPPKPGATETNLLTPDLIVLTGDFVTAPVVGSWSRAAASKKD